MLIFQKLVKFFQNILIYFVVKQVVFYGL